MFNIFKKKTKTPRKISNLKVSVVMPVYLGEYEGAAKDREEKFKRAVISFTSQLYKNKELIIVSDGCDIAEKVYKECLVYKEVKFIKIKKQPLFSGNVRDEGVKNATGDVICYLDSDDALGLNHLKVIAQAFEKDPNLDFVYYNDVLLPFMNNPQPREVHLEYESVGTSSIAHRSDLPKVAWKDCDGYGHDWKFIEKLINGGFSYSKIYGAEYYVCHVPNMFDN